MKKVLYGTYYKPEGGESQTENGNIPQIFRNGWQNRRQERVKKAQKSTLTLRRCAISKTKSRDRYSDFPPKKC